MTVRAVWTPDGSFEVTESGYAPEGAVLAHGRLVKVDTDGALRSTLLAGAACNDARLTDSDGT